MSLPPDLIERGLKLARGANFMGERIEDLTREELMAIAALGWQAYSNQITESIRRTELYL